jgi:hypothetical protein
MTSTWWECPECELKSEFDHRIIADVGSPYCPSCNERGLDAIEMLPCDPPKPLGKFILYDFDADELATTYVYNDYDEAKNDANQLDNVLILKLPLEDIPGEDQENPDA